MTLITDPDVHLNAQRDPSPLWILSPLSVPEEGHSCTTLCWTIRHQGYIWSNAQAWASSMPLWGIQEKEVLSPRRPADLVEGINWETLDKVPLDFYFILPFINGAILQDIDDAVAYAAKARTHAGTPTVAPVFTPQRQTKQLLQRTITLQPSSSGRGNNSQVDDTEDNTLDTRAPDINSQADVDAVDDTLLTCAMVNITAVKGKLFNTSKSQHYAVFRTIRYQDRLEAQALAADIPAYVLLLGIQVDVAYRSGREDCNRGFAAGGVRGLPKTYRGALLWWQFEACYHLEAKNHEKLTAAGKAWDRLRLPTGIIRALSHFVYPQSEEIFYEGTLKGCPYSGARATLRLHCIRACYRNAMMQQVTDNGDLVSPGAAFSSNDWGFVIHVFPKLTPSEWQQIIVIISLHDDKDEVWAMLLLEWLDPALLLCITSQKRTIIINIVPLIPPDAAVDQIRQLLLQHCNGHISLNGRQSKSLTFGFTKPNINYLERTGTPPTPKMWNSYMV
ncbi:hypothetical protein C8J57DRAFT_1502751 [Mycena rebaudengoi]|nr:hypothetical protein C8J57DRAFT_1502751 [Mycena rebaudengoi]